MSQKVPCDVVTRSGATDYGTGTVAHYGDGQYHSRDGTDLAAYFARRLVAALHVDRSGYDFECQPPNRRGLTYRVNYER